MRIVVTSVFVEDQEEALGFYTEVLGFQKKSDVPVGEFRWLTVVSPEEPDGAELHLELNADPAAKTFQQSLFQQGKPAAMFYVDDVQREYERTQGLGAQFTMPPTKTTGSTIAILNDTCGNLIQLVKLDW